MLNNLYELKNIIYELENISSDCNTIRKKNTFFKNEHIYNLNNKITS